MNKKLIVKNKLGEIIYCILSDQESFEKQLNKVFGIDRNACYGFTVDFGKDFVAVKDIRTQEIVSHSEILSFLDTDEDVVLTWQKSD